MLYRQDRRCASDFPLPCSDFASHPRPQASWPQGQPCSLSVTSPPQLPLGTAALTLPKGEAEGLFKHVSSSCCPKVPTAPPNLPLCLHLVPKFHPARRQIEKDSSHPKRRQLCICIMGGSRGCLCLFRGGGGTLAYCLMWGQMGDGGKSPAPRKCPLPT